MDMEDGLDRGEILRLLRATPLEEVRQRAEATLLRVKGRHVHVRGLVEFSNSCRRNCLYCGLRAANGRVRRYTLGQEEILAAARAAVDAGADTVVLQSGEGAVSAPWLAEVVREIVRVLRVPVTLSVGECRAADYALWREAGASRYLLKHETADAALYARLHPGYTLAGRVACLKLLADLGYETGSGFMIGLPGQDVESLTDDILLARDLRVAMCGAGPFLPQADTPLARCAAGTAELTLRVLSVLRLALPWANLPATTALATADPAAGQRDGLRAGANVLMPSFTPPRAAADYVIYDAKNRVGVRDAARAIEAAGRSHGLRAGGGAPADKSVATPQKPRTSGCDGPARPERASS